MRDADVRVTVDGARADTQFIIPVLSLEWMLLDFGRRRAVVDAAEALVVEANAGFNAKHQEIVFAVTRDFYALTAASATVSDPSPAPTSTTWLPASAPASAAIARARLGSIRKFCPRDLVGRMP